MEDRITPAEFLLLGVYLGGPVIVFTAVCQAAYLAARGLAAPGQRLRLVGWVVSTAVVVYLLTYVAWIGIPQKYLWWWGTKGHGFWPFMVLGVAFVPSIIAAMLASPAMTCLAARVGARRRTTG